MSNEVIISLYATREATIREIALMAERSYSATRRILVKAGFSNGKKRK